MLEGDPALDGSVASHNLKASIFNDKQIVKRRSEELREEFSHLVSLKWQTVTN